MQNRRKKLSESMPILTLFRVGFHRKSCAREVFVCMCFFINLLTVSWRRDPGSTRAGAVETQFLNLRIIVGKCTFCFVFLHILRHLDLISFARNTCKNKGKKTQEISCNLGPKTGPRKVIFWCVFGVWFRRFPRMVPSALSGALGWSQKRPPGSPRTLKVSPKAVKMDSRSYPKSTQINKKGSIIRLASCLVNVATIL